MLKDGYTYQLNTFYQYGNDERQLEAFTFKGSDYPNAATTEPSISQSYAFPFQEGMERGQLAYQGVASQDGSGKNLSTPKFNEPVIQGLITTSRLVQPSYHACQPNLEGLL